MDVAAGNLLGIDPGVWFPAVMLLVGATIGAGFTFWSVVWREGKAIEREREERRAKERVAFREHQLQTLTELQETLLDVQRYTIQTYKTRKEHFEEHGQWLPNDLDVDSERALAKSKARMLSARVDDQKVRELEKEIARQSFWLATVTDINQAVEKFGPNLSVAIEDANEAIGALIRRYSKGDAPVRPGDSTAKR